MNILLVEDDLNQLQSITRALEMAGYTVYFASNGHDALDYFNCEEINIDLLITDFNIPGFNGLELIKAIRKKNKNLPAIIMTGYAKIDLEEKITSCQGYQIIEKPFSYNMLIGKVEMSKNLILQHTYSQKIIESHKKLTEQIISTKKHIQEETNMEKGILIEINNIEKQLDSIINASEKLQNLIGEILPK